MYLKPTQFLWSKVEQKIESMFQERLKYAADWYHYGVPKPAFDRLCMASIIDEDTDRRIQELGEKWFNVNDTIDVQIHNGSSIEAYSLPATTGGRRPFVSPHWNAYRNEYKPKVTDPAILDIAKRRHEAYTKISIEKKEFLEQVKKVWEDAPSINALAKVWPPIVDLLPADIVQKLEKKSTRRTTKQLAEGIDTKQLSVHILKAKVAQ